MPPKEGEKIPEFSGLLCDGEVFYEATIDEVIGERGCVIIFYGFAFSAVAENWWKRYKRRGWNDFEEVSVVGVGRDGPYALNAFMRSIGSPFRIFSDVDAKISEDFDLVEVREDMSDVSTPRRSIYVVDSSKEVKYRWISEDQITPPPATDVEDAVSEL